MASLPCRMIPNFRNLSKGAGNTAPFFHVLLGGILSPSKDAFSMNRSRLLLYTSVVALFGGAVYFWTQPQRREDALRTAPLSYLAAAVHDRPQDARALFYYGKQLAQAGNLPAAYDALTKAADLAPNDADTYIAAAHVANRLYGLTGAHNLLAAFVRNNPQNVRGQLALADQLFREQQNAEAEGIANAVLKRDPKNAEAWRIVGLIRLAKQQTGEALIALQNAVALDPNNAAVQTGLGGVFVEQHQCTEAIAAYRTALKIEPDRADANLMLALSLLSSDTSQKTATAAKDYALNALRFDEGNPLGHYTLGLAYHRLGDTASAGQEWDTTRLMAPTYAETYFRLAEAARQQRRMADANLWQQKHRQVNQFLADKDVRQKQNRDLSGDPKRLRPRARYARTSPNTAAKPSGPPRRRCRYARRTAIHFS